MPVLSRAAFARALRRLDPPEFVAFVADLWRAGGHEATVSDGLVVVTDPETGDTRRLRPVSRRIGIPRARNEDRPVDAVVTARRGRRASRLAAAADARLLGPDDLRDRLLYGVDREDAEALAGTYFDRPLAAAGRPDSGRRGRSAARLLAGVRTRLPASARSRLPSPDFSDYPDLPTPAALPVGPGTVATALLVLALVVAALAGPGAGAGALLGNTPLGSSALSGTAGGVDGVEGTGADAEASETGIAAASALYPPGFGPEGVTDLDALARTHVEVATDRSYRLRVVHEGSRDLDGTRWLGAWSATRVENRSTYFYTVTGYRSADPSFPARRRGDRTAELVQYAVYADGTHRYRRQPGENASYERAPLPADEREAVLPGRAAAYLERYLATPDSRLDSPEWSLYPYRITATGEPRHVPGNVSNYTATALVDYAGFVHRLRVSYTLHHRGESTTVRFRLEYADLDYPGVVAPSWYDEARARTAGPDGPDGPSNGTVAPAPGPTGNITDGAPAGDAGADKGTADGSTETTPEGLVVTNTTEDDPAPRLDGDLLP